MAFPSRTTFGLYEAHYRALARAVVVCVVGVWCGGEYGGGAVHIPQAKKRGKARAWAGRWGVFRHKVGGFSPDTSFILVIFSTLGTRRLNFWQILEKIRRKFSAAVENLRGFPMVFLLSFR